MNRYLQLMNPESPLFKAVEDVFYKWLENSNPAMEYFEMYFGEEAVYDHYLAIKAGIEHVFEVMDQESLIFITLEDNRLDFDSVFS